MRRESRGGVSSYTIEEVLMRRAQLTATLVAIAVAVACAAASLVPAVAQAAAPNLSASAKLHSITSLTPSNLQKLPAAPRRFGCFAAAVGSWRSARCETPAYIAAHVPHPEVLSGVGGRTVEKSTAAPFTGGEVWAAPLLPAIDVDSQFGVGAYSLQDNVFFTGSGGNLDSVQFTDQTSGAENNVCIWQVDVTTQSYTPSCIAFPTSAFGSSIIAVEGVVLAPGVLGVSAMSDNGTILGLVIAPDIYGLESGHRWNNNSGSVLGYGNGSEAQFLPTDEIIAVRSTSCIKDAGFLTFTSACTSTPVEPLAYTGYQPGALTLGAYTVESNNLIPVIGSPPAHLPGIDYLNTDTAMIEYGASTDGKCLSGTPPYCV
jgi:hypothetical protein